jgi:AcrR family transcriptional regulator
VKRPQLLAGEDIPPAPVQRRSVEKRQRVVRAALALFAERGYERTSLDEIAERAHVAVGGIYLHFRGKRQLLLVLMDELLEHLAALDLAPRASSDVRSALHAMLTRAFATDLTYLGAYRAWSEAARADRELEALDRQIRVWTTGRVRAVFEHLQRLPGARPDVDVAALARMMDVLFWNQLARAAILRPAELREWISAATHLIYHALFLDLSEPRRRPPR